MKKFPSLARFSAGGELYAEPMRAQYVPQLQHLYEVRLVEFPRPPQSAAPTPVLVNAYGPIDAVLKAGPKFDEVIKSRRVRPLAYLNVYEPNTNAGSQVPWVAVKPFTAEEAPLCTNEIDEENGR